MSTVSGLTCVSCGAAYGEGEASTCPACGPDEGILDVQFDLRAARRTMTRAALAERPRSHWRYRELLPVDDLPAAGHATMGTVGWTPLIEAPRLALTLQIGRLRLKDEGRNPSASFKDRASSIGALRAVQARAAAVACASTGNAASSLACCAAAIGIPAYIFVPQSVPQGKLAQLLAFGARVFRVRGSYAQAYDLCTAACVEFDWYNRNAAINPYLVEGKKTGGLELAEQCGDDPAEWVACSVGDGCSIAGVYKGLAQMKALGLAPATPRMLGVQPADVAPISAAFETGRLDRSGTGTTYADSINVAVPRNWRKAVNAVRESGGVYVNVSDDEIMQAVRLTGQLGGVFAEPAGAAAVAGIAAARRKGILTEKSSVVAMITGNGLKDVAGGLRAVGDAWDVAPTLAEVEAALRKSS